MKYEHCSTSESFVSLFFQQVPNNVVKLTSGKQERVTKMARIGLMHVSLGFSCMCVTVLV